jgi:hypothetical protein
MRATAAGADIARWMDNLFARQMLGQRPGHRLTPFPLRALGLIRRLGRGRARAFAFLQIFKLQFKLRDLNVELLRWAAELHPAQLRKLRFELFDQDAGSGQFVQRCGQFRIAFGKPGMKRAISPAASLMGAIIPKTGPSARLR